MSTDIRGMIIFYSIYMKVVSVLPAIFIFCYPGPLDRDRSLEEKKKVSGPEGGVCTEHAVNRTSRNRA